MDTDRMIDESVDKDAKGDEANTDEVATGGDGGSTTKDDTTGASGDKQIHEDGDSENGADTTETGDGEESESEKEDETDTANDDDVEVDTDKAVAEAKTDVATLPPVNQYIYENLPEIKTSGTIAGKDVTINVKTANEIPDGFEWKNKRDEKLFDQALIDQGVKANNLSTEYGQKQGQEVLQKEYNDIQSDLTELQSEGLIAKFTSEQANNNPDTPGVKVANDVLAIYQKTNQEYAAKGRAYRISYRDAYEKYEMRQEKAKAATTKNVDRTERRAVAAKVGGSRTGEESNRLPIAPGVTVDDILASHDHDWD